MAYIKSFELTKEQEVEVSKQLLELQEKYKDLEGIIWDETGMFKMDGSKRIDMMNAPTHCLQMQEDGKLKRVKIPTQEAMAELWD